MKRQRCAKRVFSGERGDFGGHMCGNYAQAGSSFCHVHITVEPGTRDAVKAPQVSSSRSTTYRATLTWKPGEGPIVVPPYYSKAGCITALTAVQVDDRDYRVMARGYVMKKDGTPGLQTWDANYQAETVIPADVLQLLLDALAKEVTR